jgi:5-methylthioadenosine/S-adenosylhomocysteine deaminase
VSRTLVLGDPVVSLDRAAVVADGGVIVDGSDIVEVGARTELEQHGPFDAVLGGPTSIVMPGFVNGHYHSECWTGPGLIGTIFELSNLFLGTSPREAGEASEEVLELLATYGLVNAEKGGQTAAVDVFYGKPSFPRFGSDAVLRAHERVGMRAAFALSLRDQNRYVHEADDRFLARLRPDLADEVRRSPLGYAWRVDDVFAAYDGLVADWDGRHGRFRVLLAPDWTPAVSDDLYRRVRRVATEYGTGFTTHVLETRSELMWNLEVYGKPAVRRLHDLGVLGDDVSFSHFVWATDDDLAVFRDSGVVAVTNVGSNLRLSSGIARVRDILRGGGRLAFGTDGISVGDREDFFQELRTALLLQRQPDVIDDHRIDSEQALRAAGENGARAIGVPGRVGRLAPGTHADLLVLDAKRIFFPPGRYAGTPVLDVILDRAHADDLTTVMVHGRVVVDKGRVVTVDEDAVVDRINELADRLYPSSGDSARWLEIAGELWPHARLIYDRWYGMPVEQPASIYNTRTAPPIVEPEA